MALISCPTCGESVSSVAAACPKCGHPIAPTQSAAAIVYQQPAKWSPGVAALLSLVIPGAGQMYKGQVINGLFWLVLVVVGYFVFIVPGLILHLVCILGAASGNPRK